MTTCFRKLAKASGLVVSSLTKPNVFASKIENSDFVFFNTPLNIDALAYGIDAGEQMQLVGTTPDPDLKKAMLDIAQQAEVVVNADKPFSEPCNYRKDLTRIHLKPDETAALNLVLPPEHFSVIDAREGKHIIRESFDFVLEFDLSTQGSYSRNQLL